MPQRLLWSLVAATLAALPAVAAEYAVLSTGYRIHADRHEVEGRTVRLFAGDGVTELPASLVASFEPDDCAKSAPPFEEPAPESPEKTVEEVVFDQSAMLALHPDLIFSVIAAESNFDAGAVSHKGAVGLMQLMPETAVELAVDPRKPQENVQGGTRYLRQLLDRYAGESDQLVKAIAAYNAGPAAVDRYDGIPPYAETRAFVRRVIRRFLQAAQTQTAD